MLRGYGCLRKEFRGCGCLRRDVERVWVFDMNIIHQHG